MSAVIAIDIGSSAIKAILCEQASGRALRIERRALESKIETPNPSYFEEDPTQLRDLVFETARALAAYATDCRQSIVGIAFTGQMHGGLVVDSQLCPLTNIITWQDKRGDEIRPSGKSYVEELRELLPADPTGVSIHTGFLAATLYWLVENKAMPARTSKVLGIYDWLTSMFAGRAVTDITSAAAWGVYDIVALGWKHDIISAANISPEWLPEVAEPGVDLGPIDKGIADILGLPYETRIYGSIGDTQASYLGSGCTAEEILLNFGTGSQSMWEIASSKVSQPVATEGTDIRYLRDGRYIVTVPTLAGGKAYWILAEFFRSVLQEFGGIEPPFDKVYAIMDALALRSDSGGILFDPIFSGSKFRDERDLAAISGITGSNFTSKALVRALVEGMIEEVAVPYFIREGKCHHKQLVGAGNGLRKNAALREVAEQRFGLSLMLSEHLEEAAYGAAKLCNLER